MIDKPLSIQCLPSQPTLNPMFVNIERVTMYNTVRMLSRRPACSYLVYVIVHCILKGTSIVGMASFVPIYSQRKPRNCSEIFHWSVSLDFIQFILELY